MLHFHSINMAISLSSMQVTFKPNGATIVWLFFFFFVSFTFISPTFIQVDRKQKPPDYLQLSDIVLPYMLEIKVKVHVPLTRWRVGTHTSTVANQANLCSSAVCKYSRIAYGSHVIFATSKRDYFLWFNERAQHVFRPSSKHC